MAHSDCPIRVPVRMPTTVASANPKATRWMLAEMCQNRPLSVPPLS